MQTNIFRCCCCNYGIKSNKNKIGPFLLGTDGSGFNALKLEQGKNEVEMNGAQVLTFAMSIVPENVRKLIQKSSLSLKKIDYFIFHQASKYILDNINRKLLIPKIKLMKIMIKLETQFQPQYQ